MPQAMNARERSRRETHKRLLETGLRLFSTHGVSGTRASDVAQAAGVAVGTLYLHFKDKPGLLRAILFEGVEELLESLRALAAHPPDDTHEAVRTHSEIIVHFAEQHRALCRLLFDPEAVQSNIAPEITDYLVSMQRERLLEGIEAGLFPGDLDPLVAAHAVVGMCMQVLDWWTRHPDLAGREAVVDTLTRLRTSGLYRAAGTQDKETRTQ